MSAAAPMVSGTPEVNARSLAAMHKPDKGTAGCRRVHMNSSEAIAAVAAERGLSPHSYTAHQAPAGSMHDGLWYVSERDAREMPIDDSVWIVFLDGCVTRGIPVGNPINPPTPPESLRVRP